MSILIPTASTPGPTVTLEALQVLERLGGSDGYLKYLQNPAPVSAEELGKSVDITGWHSTLCEIQFYQGCFSSWAEAHTLDGHKVRIEGWGYATEPHTSCGRLFFNDWDSLMGEPVIFTAKTGVDGKDGRLTIWFARGGLLVGKYVGSEPIGPGTIVQGSCTWKSILDKDN